MFERLREMRQSKGYTCGHMADKMGLTKPHIIRKNAVK